MDIKAHLDGILKPHDVSGNLKMDVAHLDWQALHLMDTRFQTSQHLGVRFSSDLRKRYAVEAEMTNATIVTAKRIPIPRTCLSDSALPEILLLLIYVQVTLI